MWEQILPGLRIKIFMTVLLGVIYPLAMTGISQVLFPKQANGSLITAGGKVIGSTDELGFRAVEDKVHVHDLHGTMLALLGLDHKKLTYQFQARVFSSTSISGR